MKLNIIRGELNNRLNNNNTKPINPFGNKYRNMYLDFTEQLKTPIDIDIIKYLINVDNFNIMYSSENSSLWNMYFEIQAPFERIHTHPIMTDII